jgi:hypothetical protein
MFTRGVPVVEEGIPAPGTVCEDCGKVPATYHGPCPYHEEINGDKDDYVEEICDVCDDCHHERCLDI